jgi:hypothetical protein
MSTQINRAFVDQFQANVWMLAQQMNSRLRNTVTVEPVRGEFAFFDQIGQVDPVEITSRHADGQITEVPHGRRRLASVPWAMNEIVDRQDTNRMLQDPSSSYVRAFAAGMARQMDRTILQGMFATAATGRSGETGVPLPTSQIVPVDYVESGSNTNSSLTVAKLRRARELLLDAGADENDGGMFIACRQREINSLLRDTTVSSADFNTVRALVNGEVNSFMGFTFVVVSHRAVNPIMQFDSSGNARVAAYCRTALTFGINEEPFTTVLPDPAKNANNRVIMTAQFGAVRMEEERVVDIRCHPTTF